MSEHTNNLWLCLHFKQLPIEIFTRAGQAAAEHHAVVIIQQQKVQYMNNAAKTLGITIGSSMDTAYALGSQIVTFERNEDKELNTLSHLAQWSYQFTPCVAIKTPHSLLLNIRGCLNLFGGLMPLIQTINKELSMLGYSARLAIHSTPLAALCLAESERLAESEQPENISTNLTNSIAESNLILQKVAIDYLRADNKIIKSLHQMGIRSVGELLALPMDGLNRRFGVFFTDYLQRLRGNKADPQKYISEIPHFSSDITFLADVTNIQSLAFPVKRLLTELSHFLRARQLHINHFSFKLSHRSHQSKTFSIYLANPANNVAMFLMLAQLQLDKINDMPEVDNLCLIASTFYPATTQSDDLFSSKHGNQEDASQLLNMFRARLGPQACFGLSLANDHRPEKSWKPVRLDTIQLKRHGYWFPGDEVGFSPRPTHLLGSPKPLPANSLELLQGPERIDFAWWDRERDGKDSARDYFIARHTNGSLYWIYKHIATGQWYLHGIFA